MNLTAPISVRKFIRILCLVLLLLLGNIRVTAQSNVDPQQLEKKIANAADDHQKVELLITLSSYYLNKPGEEKADIEEAERLNLQAGKLSTILKYKTGTGKVMLLSAQINREKGEREKALKLTNQALAYAKRNNLPVITADTYKELCAYKGYERPDIEQKVKYLELAIPLYRKGRAVKKEADALKDLADYYGLLEQNQKALGLLENAVSLYKSIGFKELQGVYTLMSGNYGLLQNAQLSLQYALLAEKTAEEVQDQSYQWCTIYNHLGLAYYDLLKFDLAFANFEKALNIALENKNIGDVNAITYNLASLYCHKKNYKAALRTLKRTEKNFPPTDEITKIRQLFIFAVSYSMLKETEKARPYYEQLLKKYNESDLGLFYKLTGIIIYLQQSGQPEKTYAYLEKFRKFAEESNNLVFYSQIELLAFQSDQASKKYESAIKHLKQHQVYKDSIFNLEKLKQSTALELQFETEKKDKNIKLLRQQGKLQEAKIQNEKVIRYVFIGSIIVLILFAALLYNRSRLKNRANKKLELKRQQIDEQNEQLKKLLSEKEWLLKEIHHRVKNNLQIVISLLNTQSAYLDNEDALMAIQNSQHRMHAMSLIHQKLYQSDNLATIDMSWYIYELINYIKECYSSEKNISFVMDIDKIFLDVAQAVPLGLILNEAVNNTIKYAFPESRKGEVQVSFKNMEKDHYKLIISDNGIGLPDGFDIDETESLGMNLMRGLTDQLDGNFTLESKNGLKIIINFRKNTDIDDQHTDFDIVTE
ncbi:Two-component sensor histidine kinase, contains HisKA and HATPase domains [Chryseobacterium taichungense]|uniref:histidine kinase n=1 Tax=Chryseobacterium taichungense TaxID=295069 RepID=A0A1H7XAC2_9FLAO|nr:histidine kinase dimerization/phosphoacceptor domain -containing protein [Chryseobacterium taichungense]SEM30760.1 Two-component sensor histidine kinase, contains HisKA and HATPase domains [Chryseobacterium taichungense]